MLKTLLIQNYALISDIEIEFERGLNILTGETGTGKSILLGALATILGERVDTAVLRTGASKAIIEGIFEISSHHDLDEYLSEKDLGKGYSELILRREILASGRTRAYINDTPVQLAVLQMVGDFLVDLHGQHDHQSLLQEKKHVLFLDEFGDLNDEVTTVINAYQQLRDHKSKLKELVDKQAGLNEHREYLSFQLEELNKLNPNPEEEENLFQEEKRILHSERLFELTANLYGLLYGAECSIFDQLNEAINKINELAQIDQSASTFSAECESAKVLVEELAKTFQEYNSGIEYNSERLDIIQSRLSELSGLKKKYGMSLGEIIEYRQRIQDELTQLTNLSVEVESKREEVQKQQQYYSNLCVQLSEQRQEVATRLENLIPDILAYLGMPGSRFKIEFEHLTDPNGEVTKAGISYRGNRNGMDFAQFYISTNTGEGVRPLAKVASGGEISRIMLAFKSVLAREGRIPVLIFDEIDSGVSGRIARAVGHKLRELAEFHQVICITHLPQIASMGASHFLVEKTESGGRSHTGIRKISDIERELAVAQLLAGETVSPAHLNSARELLQDSEAS